MPIWACPRDKSHKKSKLKTIPLLIQILLQFLLNFHCFLVFPGCCFYNILFSITIASLEKEWSKRNCFYSKLEVRIQSYRYDFSTLCLLYSFILLSVVVIHSLFITYSTILIYHLFIHFTVYRDLYCF